MPTNTFWTSIVFAATLFVIVLWINLEIRTYYKQDASIKVMRIRLLSLVLCLIALFVFIGFSYNILVFSLLAVALYLQYYAFKYKENSRKK